MAHVFQVGAGSGGMAALDLIARDPRVTRVTLVEPDVYEARNVVRHVFPASAVGLRKAELAREWLRERRPGLAVEAIVADVTAAAVQETLNAVLRTATLGVCAADNEPAKFHFDALMRRHRLPWALGEVLAGGVGGFVHAFTPGGPCYGCVVTRLQRETPDEPPGDYAAAPGEVPAGIAAIHAIASLHALTVLQLLETSPPWTSLLMPLAPLPGAWDEAFAPRRFRVERSAACLTCGGPRFSAEGMVEGGSESGWDETAERELAERLRRLSEPRTERPLWAAE